MIVSIIQPAYLPWLGYFHRIWMSDLHIVLDHVQVDRNSKTKFANRNKIRTPDGWCWITVPIKTKGRGGTMNINQLEVDDTSKWRRKNWSAIWHNYTKSEFFSQHKDFFETVYNRSVSRLIDINMSLTHYLLKALGITTPLIFSSQMEACGTKNNLILNLCREVGATTYISGPFGRDYLQLDKFKRCQIRVVYHDYVHPVYQQSHPQFEPFMSVIDLLFNAGPQSLKILSGGQPSICHSNPNSGEPCPTLLP